MNDRQLRKAILHLATQHPEHAQELRRIASGYAQEFDLYETPKSEQVGRQLMGLLKEVEQFLRSKREEAHKLLVTAPGGSDPDARRALDQGFRAAVKRGSGI